MHIYFCLLNPGQKHAQRNVGVWYNFHYQNEHLVSTHLNGKCEPRAVMWHIVILRQKSPWRWQGCHITSAWICEMTKAFHSIQNTPKQTAAMPCTGSHNYLIKTHDILGRIDRIDRGKDGLLGEKREGQAADVQSYSKSKGLWFQNKDEGGWVLDH